MIGRIRLEPGAQIRGSRIVGPTISAADSRIMDELTNRDLVGMLLKGCGASWDLVVNVPDRKGHDRRYSVDWANARQELGYQPRHDLRASIPSSSTGTPVTTAGGNRCARRSSQSAGEPVGGRWLDGVLGQDVVASLAGHGQECIALARTDLDITDAGAVWRTVAGLAPDIIVTCRGGQL